MIPFSCSASEWHPSSASAELLWPFDFSWREQIFPPNAQEPSTKYIADSGPPEYCSIFHLLSVTGVTYQLSAIIWWVRPWKLFTFSECITSGPIILTTLTTLTTWTTLAIRPLLSPQQTWPRRSPGTHRKHGTPLPPGPQPSKAQ